MAEKKENIFLIGETHDEIPKNKLPSNLEVLKFLFHNIRILKLSLRESEILVLDELITIYQLAKTPIQQKSRCMTKIDDLYNYWRSLQKSSSRRIDTQEKNEIVFSSNLDDLFDIAHRDVLTMIDDKTKTFLLNQRQPGRIGFIENMSGKC